MVTPITPLQGANTQIVSSQVAVVAVPGISGGVGGGYITNPLTAQDQGLGAAESLYVDPVGPCAAISGVLKAGGTIIALEPGQTWQFLPGQNTATWANADGAGHRFTVVYWNNA